MQRNKIYQGDCLELAKTLPDQSVHCIVTSPPYYGLRSYETAEWNGGDPECEHVADAKATKVFGNPEFNENRPSRAKTKLPGYHYESVCGKCGATKTDMQIGNEPTLQEYIDRLVELFRELRRVLHDSGTLWLNLGDSYAGSGGAGAWSKRKAGFQEYAGPRGDNANRFPESTGLKPKDLIGVPWRVAFALQDDGWWLRSDIIWHKNGMPESTKDRVTRAHEYIFMLTKSPRYYFDYLAIMEPAKESSLQRYENGWNGTTDDGSGGARSGSTYQQMAITGLPIGELMTSTKMARKRDVWRVNTAGYKGAHFAVYPPKLIEPCIMAGASEYGVCGACGAPWERTVNRDALKHNKYEGQKQKERNMGVQSGGTDFVRYATTGWEPTCDCDSEVVPAVVLDPFGGSGTTGMVARGLGRDYILFELSQKYIELARERIYKCQPALFGL